MKLLFLLAAASCLAQSPIVTPLAGAMIDASGALRTVHGVAGNFTVGPPEAASDPGWSHELALPGLTISSREGVLLLRRDDRELRFELLAIHALRVMGPEFVQVRTASANYALRITPYREQLFLLPSPSKTIRQVAQ